jgi:large subunit ribosomal protein L9
MDVILLERIENLGQMGDVVKVRPGFARNYLLPQKKALRASAENKSQFERQRAQLETINLKRRQEAEAVAGRMQGVAIDLIRQAGESGQLYGSVSARDIAEGLTEAGYSAERRQVQIDRPIKSLGLFDVRILLHPEVSVTVTVNVARSPDEAKLQAQRGGMVTGELPEEEEARLEAEAEFEELVSGGGDEQPPTEEPPV